ncbi:MAG: TetR/AcrR family transcriptional regulator [Mycobacterium sp.]|nr:TetR/AcrR family transcriptional regulator [Mycobacterium sp.]
MLGAALRCSGDPGSMSDTAAVVHHTTERRATTFSTLSTLVQADVPMHERVGAIIDTLQLHHGLGSADSRAIEKPPAPSRDREKLERRYPRTAVELGANQVREVATLIRGATHRPESERRSGCCVDVDVARRGLTHALGAYLEQSR